MEVILLERIAKLGQMGEQVRVKDGYARNFLLPRGKALRATEANKKRFESQRAQLEARNLEQKSEAEKIKEKLDGKTFVIIRRWHQPQPQPGRADDPDQGDRPACRAGSSASGSRSFDHLERRPFAGRSRASGPWRGTRHPRRNQHGIAGPRSWRRVGRSWRRRRLIFDSFQRQRPRFGAGVLR